MDGRQPMSSTLASVIRQTQSNLKGMQHFDYGSRSSKENARPPPPPQQQQRQPVVEELDSNASRLNSVFDPEVQRQLDKIYAAATSVQHQQAATSSDMEQLRINLGRDNAWRAHTDMRFQELHQRLHKITEGVTHCQHQQRAGITRQELQLYSESVWAPLRAKMEATTAQTSGTISSVQAISAAAQTKAISAEQNVLALSMRMEELQTIMSVHRGRHSALEHKVDALFKADFFAKRFNGGAQSTAKEQQEAEPGKAKSPEQVANEAMDSLRQTVGAGAAKTAPGASEQAASQAQAENMERAVVAAVSVAEQRLGRALHQYLNEQQQQLQAQLELQRRSYSGTGAGIGVGVGAGAGAGASERGMGVGATEAAALSPPSR